MSDFYQAVMRDPQAPAAGASGERERWLRSVDTEGREELVFELEMLLRGVERYFNLHNLPLASREVLMRDFHDELVDVRDALDRSIAIMRHLLDARSDAKLVFRKYVETVLADDRARRTLVDDSLEQHNPQEALFQLRARFEALRTVVDHVLRLPDCPYALFADLGGLLLRDVARNRYFRPFKPLEFRPEYDRIKSVAVLEALAQQAPRERELFTVAFLALFRALHYLSYVGLDGGATPERRSRVILALVRSELTTLVGFLKTEVAAKLVEKRQARLVLRMAREVGREGQRIAERLAQAAPGDTASALLAAADYTSVLRLQLVVLQSVLEPSFGTDDLAVEQAFRRLVSRTEMSLRLRKDLWVYAELCRAAEIALRREGDAGAVDALRALKGFAQYFHDVSYQLLRFGDYEAFDRLIALIEQVARPPDDAGARARLSEDCRMFAQLAETTFAGVSRRADLGSHGFDLQDAARLLQRF